MANANKSHSLSAQVSEENKFALQTNGNPSVPSGKSFEPVCIEYAVQFPIIIFSFVLFCSLLFEVRGRQLTCAMRYFFLATRSGTYDDDLRDYARKLLGTFSDPNLADNNVQISAVSSRDGLDVERDREREEEGALNGCRQAVEILTRNPKKGQFYSFKHV